MKGNYTKPVMAMEWFFFRQSGARDCADSIPESQVNFNDPARCVWDLGGGMSVFVAGTNCVLDGENMGYGCYNNPSEGNYIFRS